MDNTKKIINNTINSNDLNQTKTISTTRNSLFLTLKSGSKTETREIKPVEEIRVTADKFASRIKALDSVSNVSSSAKMKLMEMRFSKNKSTVTENEFVLFMENKPYSKAFMNPIGEKSYIFLPDRLSTGFEGVNLIKERKHTISDKLSANPPTLEKIADLQQLIGIKPTGFIEESTFKALMERYEKALFGSEIKIMSLLDKLMLNLLQKIGLENKTGKFIKGLLLAKTIIIASEEGKFGGYEKMNQMIGEYFPDITRTKLRIRIRLIRKIYLAINANNQEKAMSLNILLKEEQPNLSIKDKVKILGAYAGLFPNLRESDVTNQIHLIKSIIGFELEDKERDIIKNTITLLIDFLRARGHREEVEEIESLYYKIKLHALSQII